MTLPTPEQERIAVAALIAWLVFGVIGVVAVACGCGLALVWLARWVWGLA